MGRRGPPQMSWCDMKHAMLFGLAGLMLSAVIAPSFAQDAGQIARIRGGAKSCAGCNLFQADFSYLDVERANLSKARLRQADLSLGTFDGANFAGADLSVSNAFGGRFTRANFAGANLENASFVGAYLGYSNFAGAKLTGANFSGAEMVGARGLSQNQLNTACGDAQTLLPRGLSIPRC